MGGGGEYVRADVHLMEFNFMEGGARLPLALLLGTRMNICTSVVFALELRAPHGKFLCFLNHSVFCYFEKKGTAPCQNVT